YPSIPAWKEAREAVKRRIPATAEFRGHLGESADRLFAALSAIMDVDRDLARLNTYANQLSDEDVRISEHLEMRQSAEQLRVQFRASISYLQPEILAVGAEKIRSFAVAEARLVPYTPFLEDILRRAPHT